MTSLQREHSLMLEAFARREKAQGLSDGVAANFVEDPEVPQLATRCPGPRVMAAVEVPEARSQTSTCSAS